MNHPYEPHWMTTEESLLVDMGSRKVQFSFMPAVFPKETGGHDRRRPLVKAVVILFPAWID